jgi:hypothetical protein
MLQGALHACVPRALSLKALCGAAFRVHGRFSLIDQWTYRRPYVLIMKIPSGVARRGFPAISWWMKQIDFMAKIN